jgi:hypothetical protein
MPAWTTKINHVDTIDAAHINDIQKHIIWDVPEYYGAIGDGATDDTAALNAAIAASAAAGRPLALRPVHYAIYGPVYVNANAATIIGAGNLAADLMCMTADAGLVISKSATGADNGGYIYSPYIQNITISGRGIADVGLKLIDVSEGYFFRVYPGSCTRGMQIRGDLGAGMMWFDQCVIANNDIGVDIYYGAYADFTRCDLYNNTTNFDLGSIGHFAFTESWAEKFTTMFLFDHSLAHAGSSFCGSAEIRNNYLLSTEGGAGNACRIFSFTGDTDTKATTVGPVRFVDNQLYLTAAEYIAEVNWTNGATTNWLATNRAIVEFSENHIAEGSATTAWFATDIDPAYSISNRIVFRNNEYGQNAKTPPADIVIQDTAAPHTTAGTITGVGSWGLNFGTDNKVLGDLDVANIVPTGNSLAVKGGIAAGLNRALWVRGGADSNGAGPALVFNPRWGGDSYPTWVGAEVAGVAHDGSYKTNMVFATNDGTNATSSTEKARIDHAGNVGIGVPVMDTTGKVVLAIANGTAPGAHIDNTIQVYSVDSSDATATLGLMLEQAVEDIGTFTASHKIKVKINGTEYWLQLDAV